MREGIAELEESSKWMNPNRIEAGEAKAKLPYLCLDDKQLRRDIYGIKVEMNYKVFYNRK